MEVRSGHPLRAWDRTGLYDNLERSADINGEVQIAFDPQWHFPRYIRTVVLPGPDTWSIIEVRALQPI